MRVLAAVNSDWRRQALAVVVSFALPLLAYPLALTHAAGDHWERIAGLAAGGTVRQIPCGQADGQVDVYLSVEDWGILLSEDGGRFWRPINDRLPRGNLGCVATSPLALAPNSAQFLLVGVSGQNAGGRPVIYKTRDGGLLWVPRRGLGTEDINALVIGPGGVAYAASGRSLYCSTDAGDTWLETGRRPTASVALSMAVDKTDSVVYVGTEADGIWLTADRGVTWRSALPNHSVYTLVVSATGAVYAGADDGLYASSDRGATWHPIPLTSGEPVKALAVASGVPDRLFVGASGNTPVLYSANGGASWRPLSPVLLGAPVTALALDPGSEQRLYVGTSRGLWRCVLAH